MNIEARVSGPQCSVPLFSELTEQEKAEYWAALALRYSSGIGARTLARLLKYFGSAFAAFENVSEWQALRVSRSSQEAVKKGQWRQNAKKEWEQAKGTRILLWNNSLYPTILRDIPDAPAFLYILGNPALLASPCVSLVGSRKASPESRKIAATLAQFLSASGITIVSGMAVGIDSAAHRGALQNIGASIGVLGTGIKKCYPSDNADLFLAMKERGLLVSEFAPDMPPKPANFPVRNRIISGLSLGTVVVEAAVKSGSLITAQLACDQNREVFAVPGTIFSERSTGCQNLIRQGAHSVFSHEDILRELSHALRSYGEKYHEPTAPLFSAQKNEDPKPLLIASESHITKKAEKETVLPESVKQQIRNEPALRIQNCLKKSSMHVEALAQETGLEMNDLNSALIMLELTGIIRRLPGARFEICE